MKAFIYILISVSKTFELKSDSRRSSWISQLGSPREERQAMTSQADRGDSNTPKRERPLSKTNKDRQNKKKDEVNRWQHPPLQYLRWIRLYGCPTESETCAECECMGVVQGVRL